jgi:hypothetical protein
MHNFRSGLRYIKIPIVRNFLMLKPWLYPACLFAFLELSATPSYAEKMIPLQFVNNPTSTNWIKLQQQGTTSDRQMVFAQTDTSPKLKLPRPKYLETIANAKGITSRAVGVAAVKPPLYEAFEQALQAGSSIRPEIDWLLSEGTPAGRIHGAVLLLHLDPKAGRQALEQMRSDQTMLWESSGCSITEKSVSTIVNEILQGQSVFPVPRM